MRISLFTLLLLSALSSFAQTVVAYREAPLTGGGSYSLTGTAILEEFDDGSFQFRLTSDYSTNSGPDVHIYLTNNSTFASPINLSGTFFIEDIGTETGPNQPGISHFSGAYMKTLPTLSSLAQFDHVVFTCFRFGRLHWGNGTFGPVTSVCSPSFSTITNTSCESYTSPSGAVFTTSGMFMDTISNAGGCDSIIALDLTIESINASINSNGAVLTANQSNASYQWIDCNTNTPISGETNQSFTAASSGDYAVIISNGTCTDTSTCFNTTVTGIEEERFGAEFKLYPNPASERATLELNGGNEHEPLKIAIVDALGTIVYASERSQGNRVELPLQELKSGLYFVRVAQGNSQKAIRLLRQ